MGRLGSLLIRLSKIMRKSRYLKGAVRLIQKLFAALLITFLLLLLVETIWDGSVSSYLNLNYLLVVVITMGVIALLVKSDRVQGVQWAEASRLRRRDIIMVSCAGLAGAAIVWYKTQEIGWLSYVISAVGGGLIVLLSMLIWRGDEGEVQWAEASRLRRRDIIIAACARLTGTAAVRRMKEKIAKVIELSYLQLVVIFLILVLLGRLNIIPPPINYQLFAAILPLLAIPILLRFKPSEEKRLPAVSFIMLAVFLFALSIRLLPYTHSPVPLGYDPGFYKYTVELYASALPQIPEAGLAAWVKEMYPQGLFVLSDVLHVLAGTDSLELINYLFPFLGALLVFPVFVVTRSLFGYRAGLVAAVLYAISYTQYSTYTMFYFKNVLGLMFLLLAIYSLEKKKYGLMTLMFAALGIFHRPEFLLFALILIPYFVFHRRRGIILAVLGTAVLIVPFWLTRWEVNWGVLAGTIETAVTNIQTGEGLGGGTFFDFNTYTEVSLTYLPFALIGAIYLIMKKNWNSILFYFVISSVIVVSQLLFFRRFIIPMDIAVVILAAVGINYTLLHKREMWMVIGIGASILLLLAAGFPTVTAANNARPLISEEQLGTVEWMKENTEDDAYVLATSNDAPWVLGWSGRRIIAPGLFEWDVHNKDEWMNFFRVKDPEAAKEFLDVYDDPVYIYYSKNWGNYLGLEKFQGGYFRKVYDDAAVVYKYAGGS